MYSPYSLPCIHLHSLPCIHLYSLPCIHLYSLHELISCHFQVHVSGLWGYQRWGSGARKWDYPCRGSVSEPSHCLYYSVRSEDWLSVCNGQKQWKNYLKEQVNLIYLFPLSLPSSRTLVETSYLESIGVTFITQDLNLCFVIWDCLFHFRFTTDLDNGILYDILVMARDQTNSLASSRVRVSGSTSGQGIRLPGSVAGFEQVLNL